ncbi:MAG: PAS domain S-box protein [Magnetococcales bacterium]|nr:PAS domain S-box protein [Magnetococcales bacterium]MBF0150051.1 PAS domain S-box protein [Magnetococcales bacterium]
MTRHEKVGPEMNALLARLPLTVKVFLATVLVGASVWYFLDEWQSRHIRGLFHNRLKEMVGEQASYNRIRFDHYIQAHSRMVRLLAGQKKLIEHLTRLPAAPPPTPLVHKTSPYWLPGPGVIRGFIPLGHILLLGPDHHLRELYNGHTTPLPESLHTPSASILQLSLNQDFLTRVGQRPYLLSSSDILDQEGTRLGTLMLATPLDEHFLSDIALSLSDFNGLVAILEAGQSRIIASNNPQRIASGTMLSDLGDNYFIAGQSYFDYGSSDLFIQLVTLVSAEEFESLGTSILVAERSQRLVTALSLIFAEFLIVLWMTGKISQVTREITLFSHELLGKDPEDNKTGDELITLRTRFQGLAREIVATRDALKAKLEEKKRAEMEIRKLSQAVEQSPAPVMITDAADTVIYVNPSFTRLTGYQAEEILGKNSNILQSIDTPLEVFDDLWNTVSSGKVWRGEFHNRRKDGSTYWELNTISPIQVPGEKTTHYLAIKEDISLRLEMERTLQQAREAAETANRLKDNFLTNISHELKTPLNTITGCTDLLLGSTFGPINENQKKYLQDLRKGSDRLAVLIDNLLELSRITTDQFILENRVYSIHRLVAGVEEVMIPEAREKGLALSTLVAPDVPKRLVGDPDRLRQTLLHVVRNAVKFTRRGSVSLGVTLVQSGTRPGSILFTITDTGIGIPDTLQGAIFDPFTQVDPTPSRRYEGTGLGLAIAKQIVDIMGGEIQVKSQLHQGSVFFITLPCNLPDPDLAAPEGAGHEPWVLVSGKNAMNRRIFIKLFNSMGFKTRESDHFSMVSASATGTGRQQFILICLDCSHAPAKAMDEIRSIRETSDWNTLPILLYTSGKDDAKDKTLSVPGVHIITKPLKRQQLYDTVERAMIEFGLEMPVIVDTTPHPGPPTPGNPDATA